MLPVNPQHPKKLLRIICSSGGSMNKDIFKEITDLIEILKNYNIKTQFISSDGDRFFDNSHKSLFSTLSRKLQASTFDNNLDIAANEELLYLSDILHLMKIACSRVKKKPILIYTNRGGTSSDFFFTDDSMTLNDILGLGDPLIDQSPAGKLKDSYPISLFSLINVIKLLNKGFICDALYLLPYTLLLECIRNPIWNKKSRQDLLRVCYDIFKFIYDNQIEFSLTQEIMETNKIGCEILTFGTSINLIRIMNTIIGIGVAIKKLGDIGLERLGTHLIECFFGNIRFNVYFKENYEDIMNTIAKNVLSTDIKRHYSLNVVNKTRLTQAGAKMINENDLTNVQIEFPENISDWIVNMYETQCINKISASFLQEMLQHNRANSNKITKCYIQSKLSAIKIIERCKATRI